jgi:hypothetical protein
MKRVSSRFDLGKTLLSIYPSWSISTVSSTSNNTNLRFLLLTHQMSCNPIIKDRFVILYWKDKYLSIVSMGTFTTSLKNNNELQRNYK